jgi:lysophospholipase L1-like esterase
MLNHLFALLACASLAFAADPPRHVATTPVPRTDEAAERHAKTLADPARAGARIVFLGDSITEMWAADDAGRPVWERVWKPLKALNLGVAGDRTEHVLWRLAHGAVDGLDPRVVVLLIGTNNAGQVHEPGGYRCTAVEQADGIRAIVGEVQKRCPRAVILLHAILPRGDDVDPIRPQNEAANALVKPLADGKRVRWVEFGSRFFSPGTTDVSLAWSPDQLHLNTKAYEVWASVLQPLVTEALAGSNKP